MHHYVQLWGRSIGAISITPMGFKTNVNVKHEKELTKAVEKTLTKWIKKEYIIYRISKKNK